MPNNEVAKLIDRVKRLEDEVFPRGGGPTAELEERLNQIDQVLADLQRRSSKQIHELDEEIEATIKIVASLRRLVGEQQRGTLRAQSAD
jgi:biotin synthase-related radical SAM superfamily protein